MWFTDSLVATNIEQDIVGSGDSVMKMMTMRICIEIMQQTRARRERKKRIPTKGRRSGIRHGTFMHSTSVRDEVIDINHKITKQTFGTWKTAKLTDNFIVEIAIASFPYHVGVL